jgi:hypothetical protein
MSSYISALKPVILDFVKDLRQRYLGSLIHALIYTSVQKNKQ